MRSENTAKRLLDFLMKCPCNYVGHLQFCGVIDHSTAEWATVAFSDGWLPISGWHWQQHSQRQQMCDELLRATNLPRSENMRHTTIHQHTRTRTLPYRHVGNGCSHVNFYPRRIITSNICFQRIPPSPALSSTTL